MAARTYNADYPRICADVRSGHFAPVYALHGEEPYYIDRLCECIVGAALPSDEERELGLIQLYGSECTATGVVEACRTFPMFGERQVVVVREMQQMDIRQSNGTDAIATYLAHPQPTTLLVLCYRGKRAPASAAWLKAAGRAGVTFEAQRLPDWGNHLRTATTALLDEMGVRADRTAVDMLCDYIGSDLSRMASEVEKLKSVIGGRALTTAVVMQHTSQSREWSVYELMSAVARRDIARVERIRRYYAVNPKAGPLVLVISTLFGLFSNILLAHYQPDRSSNGLVASLGLSRGNAITISDAVRVYGAWKAMTNISVLREFDARSKGARPSGSASDAQLMQELFYRLMH